MSVNGPVPPPRIRPGWVWGIFIFYVVTSTWGLLSRLLIYVGVYPVPEQQQAIIRNQSTGSILFGLVLMALNLTAAVWLWLMRKRAFDLFVATFALSVASVIWQLIGGGPLASLMTQGTLMVVITIFSLVVGWAISLAICLYAWNLRQQGVLK